MADTPDITPTDTATAQAATPAVPPPPVPAAPASPAAPAAAPNLPVGIAFGALFGLLAALVYAGIAVLAEREFLVLGLLIGFAIAFGFHRFGHTRGVVPGAIAAVIAMVMYVIAIFVETAGALAKAFDASFMDGLRTALDYPGEVFSGYFSDALSYLFVVVSVGMAFYYAWGGRQAQAAASSDAAAS